MSKHGSSSFERVADMQASANPGVNHFEKRQTMQPPRPQLSVGDELAAVHARLSGILLTEQTMRTALDVVTSLARDTLGGSLGSGVTLLSADGRPTTSAATDALTDRLDRLQYGLEEGPCLTAWAGATVVRADDLTTDERWPTWSPQAVTLGVRSVLSAPMEAGGTTWGAVKVYSETPDSYDERAEDVLQRFAAQAAIFVSNVHIAQSAERIGDEVKEALRTRNLIATATGMVMARRGVDYALAYRHLMSLASGARISLGELAERIVTSGEGTDGFDG
jgi:transcriptional regulator with GAF, ATPase, and Fis domain